MILSPSDIGMPSQFPTWRTGQGEAIDRITDAFIAKGKRFVVMCAPVGSGKTATYVGVALSMGWRVLVVTSSKGLQDQLMRDFADVGMVDIRGRGNYQCAANVGMTCEEGMHAKCPYVRDTQCPYREAQMAAAGAPMVTTNYKYEMMVYLYGEGLGKFDLVVFDEAHDADSHVCDVMGQTFTAKQVNWMLNKSFPVRPWEASIETWKTWAVSMHRIAARKLEEMKHAALSETLVSDHTAKSLREWTELAKSLQTISQASGPWASQALKLQITAYRLEPLFAREYSHVLFRDFPRVLLTSATIGTKTMDLLGVEPGDYEFQEYPYLFPVRRSPVYFIPTVKMHYEMTEAEMWLALSRVDEIMDARQDRNGLIHSVSYKLCAWIKENAIYSHTMITHERDSEATREAIIEFEGRRDTPPAVLISPSIATGNDFAYTKAEYQIIPKLPSVVVKGNRIMEARCFGKYGDPDYRNYLMAQTLAQMIGRIMRAEDDRGETIITDNNFTWAQRALRQFFPRWVLPLLIRQSTPPKPPPSLRAERALRAQAQAQLAAQTQPTL